MRRNDFPYVDQIRNADKYFDVSRRGILRILLVKGACHLSFPHDFFDEAGESRETELFLNVNTRSKSPLAWTLSLKVHDVRVDGIDFEGKYVRRGGGYGYGWHRHCWSAEDEEAERGKEPVDGFDDVTTREDFLIRGLGVLKVTLAKHDDGQELLIS